MPLDLLRKEEELIYWKREPALLPWVHPSIRAAFQEEEDQNQGWWDVLRQEVTRSCCFQGSLYHWVKCCPECSLARTPSCPCPTEPTRTPGLHSLPQIFMDAGGMTSWFTLGERRAGVKVADQRGPGPGTALAHRIVGAGWPDALGRDLVRPRGRWESPGVGEERERSKEEEKSQKNERNRKERGFPALETTNPRGIAPHVEPPGRARAAWPPAVPTPTLGV